MSSPSILGRQIDGRSRNKELCGSPTPELPRKLGVVLSVPGKLAPPLSDGTCNRLTKLLINVNIERSFGPVHVIVSPEINVGELIKMAVEAYVKEKRRPLLADTNYRRFELHYSQFSLESIKAEEKLMNLGSRNFFLCTKSNKSVGDLLEESREAAATLAFPLTRFIDRELM